MSGTELLCRAESTQQLLGWPGQFSLLMKAAAEIATKVRRRCCCWARLVCSRGGGIVHPSLRFIMTLVPRNNRAHWMCSATLLLSRPASVCRETHTKGLDRMALGKERTRARQQQTLCARREEPPPHINWARGRKAQEVAPLFPRPFKITLICSLSSAPRRKSYC